MGKIMHDLWAGMLAHIPSFNNLNSGVEGASEDISDVAPKTDNPRQLQQGLQEAADEADDLKSRRAQIDDPWRQTFMPGVNPAQQPRHGSNIDSAKPGTAPSTWDYILRSESLKEKRDVARAMGDVHKDTQAKAVGKAAGTHKTADEPDNDVPPKHEDKYSEAMGMMSGSG